MSERRRLRGPGKGEYEEKRSRFLGEIVSIDSEQQAKEYLAQVRKRYGDARHHCWAWILPDGTCRWSDDGEPGGTAGGPIAAVLRGACLEGVLCVVTRYFGGTLLGSGGLVRAYTKAASLALADAGTEPDPEMEQLSLWCPWDSLDRVYRLIRDSGAQLLDSDYNADPEKALLRVQLPAADGPQLLQRVTDATNGRVRAQPSENRAEGAWRKTAGDPEPGSP